MESKKIFIIRILQIFMEYSDEAHPLTQSDILRLLDKEYDLVCERKVIGRNISILKEAGIDIESNRKGSYLANREFEFSELRLLIDSVLSSKHINNKHSKDLIDKLIKLGGRYFKGNIKNVYSIKDWQKSENLDFFYNIDLIDEAIMRGKQISFDYNKYGVDKKLHKTASHIVSPYQMVLHNQHYYLMGKNMKWQDVSFYKIDKITNMKIEEGKNSTPIRECKGYENGIDYKAISSSLPYMYTDKPVKIVLRCEKVLIDEVINWFGYDVKFEEVENENVLATFYASELAMNCWCLQYCETCEVVEPKTLRMKIINSLSQTLDKYRKGD